MESIDRVTANRINRALHYATEIEEQIGILRDQIVHILNELGAKPTPEFGHLNELALRYIAEGQERKATGRWPWEGEHAEDDPV